MGAISYVSFFELVNIILIFEKQMTSFCIVLALNRMHWRLQNPTFVRVGEVVICGIQVVTFDPLYLECLFLQNLVMQCFPHRSILDPVFQQSFRNMSYSL